MLAEVRAEAALAVLNLLHGRLLALGVAGWDRR
jgi:hypothetical protein